MEVFVIFLSASCLGLDRRKTENYLYKVMTVSLLYAYSLMVCLKAGVFRPRFSVGYYMKIKFPRGIIFIKK
jgi:intein-encoded DNA endonuclease-like protein